MKNLENHEPSGAPEFNFDAEAFTAAIEELQPKLQAYSQSLSHDRDTAEDYLGGVFERTWKNRENIDPEKVEPYLYRSIRNAHLDNVQGKSNKTAGVSDDFLDEIPDADAYDDPQQAAQYNDFYEAFENAIDNLPPKQSKAARLRLIEELSPEEAQNALDDVTSLSALSAQLYNARKNLQQDLKDWLE